LLELYPRLLSRGRSRLTRVRPRFHQPPPPNTPLTSSGPPSDRVGGLYFHSELWRITAFAGARKMFFPGRSYSAAVTPVLAMETCPDQNNDQAHEDYVNQKLLFPVHPCVPRRAAGLQQRSCRGLPKRECKFPSWSSRRPLVTLAQTELILSLLERAGPHKLFQESTVAGRMARIGANLFRSVRPLLPFIPVGWLGEASRGGVGISVGRLFLLTSKR
jgi:hypothetical protein